MIIDFHIHLSRLVAEYGCRGIQVYPVYHHHCTHDARMYPL